MLVAPISFGQVQFRIAEIFNHLIAFNPRFMLDAIRVIDEDDIPVYMNNSRTPLILRDDAGTYTYVILPINF